MLTFGEDIRLGPSPKIMPSDSIDAPDTLTELPPINPLSVYVGEREVVYSGTIPARSEDRIVFEFPTSKVGATELPVSVHFTFVKDEENSDTRLRFQTVPPAKMEVTLFNFDSGFMSGSSGLIPIATLSDVQWYLSFRVTALEARNSDDTARLFQYTWLRDRKRKGGVTSGPA